MDSKKSFIAAVAVLSLLSAGLIYAADESSSKFYSAFGMEDPDPDLDGVRFPKDKCSASPFDLWVLNKSSKKQPAKIEFSNPLKLEQIVSATIKSITAKDVTLQVATNGSKKTYTLSGNKTTTLDIAGKRVKTMYANAKKGLVVLWASDAATPNAKYLGCTIPEEKNLIEAKKRQK